MPTPSARWIRADFHTDPISLARRLIGCRLVRLLPTGERLSGEIVETEAYLGVRDRAAHSYGGRRTERVESMYAAPGHSYVYFTYGMHYCMNVVCGDPGEPVAVLLRAIRPVEGLDLMLAARTRAHGRTIPRDRDLCSGPAKLCQALRIDRACDGLDLASSDALAVEWGGGPVHPSRLRRTARIGVAYAGEWADKPLRWRLRDSEYVSRN